MLTSCVTAIHRTFGVQNIFHSLPRRLRQSQTGRSSSSHAARLCGPPHEPDMSVCHGQTMDVSGESLDSVTCFCEVSLCSCESKKTIRLTDPARSLPCPLTLFTAFYCPLLPSAALYCMGQWRIKRSARYRLGYRLPGHISHG